MAQNNSTLTGDFRLHESFHSTYLAKDRDVLVYLPPGYSEQLERRFPVLYMQDGQNLFDGATSFIPGMEWRVDETAQALIISQAIEPLIIVGIYNAGEQRIDEYTPTRDPKYNAGGHADLYGRMLVEELKPFIDARYRTLTDPSNTALGGSSLGGLVSLYLGLKYPRVFGKLAVISPSVWWDNGVIVRSVRSLDSKLPLRIWLDMGTAESPGAARNARRLRAALVAKGWSEGEDLKYFEAKGAGHNEQAWAARMSQVLEYLFPAK
jgi:predicted alpha/beta superfamily hydrolase